MNKLIKIVALVGVIFNFSIANAQKKVDAIDLKSTLAKDKLSSKEIDDVYVKLETLVESKKARYSMKDLLELCLLYFKHDGSDVAYDFAYELKKNNSKEFEDSLKKLSKQDREKILEFIKLTEDEIKNGNG